MQIRDVIVVGAGPAGLAAASATASAGLSTLCIDRGIQGGRLARLGRVEDYPGGPFGAEVAGLLLEACLQAGADLETAEVLRLSPGPPWTLQTGAGQLAARALIVATGLSPGSLGIAGEQAFAGKGLSDCAECDGPLFAGRDVAVAGGSVWAIAEATALAASTRRVWLVCGAPPPDPDPRLSRLCALPNVSVVTGRIAALSGGPGGLEGIAVATPAGRRELPVAGLFVYENERPCSECLAGVLQREPDGQIPVDLRMRAALPLLFAAGDVRSSAPGFVLAALADGRQAGLSAVAALRPNLAEGSPCAS